MIGCGIGHGDTNNSVNTDSSFKLENEPEKMVYPIPTPLEISEMLNKAGANFILDILNKPENIDKYFTESARALNLGVYGADLSYSATYHKSQETMDFFVCTKKLHDALDLQIPYNLSLGDRIEKNIDNPDSLYYLLTALYKNTFDFLNDHQKGDVSVLVLAGGWIEGLYISTELALLTNKYQYIYQGIADQKETLEKLIPLMENYKEITEVNEISSKLKEIKIIFDDLIVVEGELQLSKTGFTKIKRVLDPLRKNLVETP